MITDYENEINIIQCSCFSGWRWEADIIVLNERATCV